MHSELSLQVTRGQEGSRHKLGLELGNKVSFQLLVGSHVALKKHLCRAVTWPPAKPTGLWGHRLSIASPLWAEQEQRGLSS